MKNDVDGLVKSCLQCIASRSEKSSQRSFAHALHSSLPSEVFYIDFLYTGRSSDNLKCLISTKGDLFSYVWIFQTEAASSEAAAELDLS